MYKLKTRKIARKRFKQTRTGKLMHRVQGARHIRRRKNKSRQRRQDRPVALDKAMSKHVQTYLRG